MELFQAPAVSLQQCTVKQLIEQKSAVISVLQKTSNFIQNYKLNTSEMLLVVTVVKLSVIKVWV